MSSSVTDLSVDNVIANDMHHGTYELPPALLILRFRDRDYIMAPTTAVIQDPCPLGLAGLLK